MHDGRQLDAFDLKILGILAQDGRIAVTDLASRVGLSRTPCQQRLTRLIDSGVIRGFRAVIDPRPLGLDHIAYTEVKLSDTIDEVEECHMIASSFDYLLKVRTANIARFRAVLGEKISRLPHVTSTSTFVVMEAVKDSTRMAPQKG